MFSDLSLKYRIAIIIFFLEAIMMSVVLQQTLGQSYESSSKQIQNNEQAILKLVSGMSKSALITEEYADLQPSIEHLLSNTEITRLLLTDAEKIVVVSSRSSDIGNHIPQLKERQDYIWQVTNITNSSGLLGVLAIEFSSQSLTNAYTSARDFGISIALIGMLIIAAVGILVGILLTRRLENITAAAKCLADGDSSARTNIQGHDEIGELASTFNTMVQRLLESKHELNQSLTSLKKREQDLEITLNSIGDAVMTTDAQGNVTRMNPIAEQLTGWTFNEAQGQPLEVIFPIINAATGEPIDSPLEKVITTGETIHLSNHTTLIAKNGTKYQIADSAAPIKDNNHISGIVLVFNNVTEQYLMREALQESEFRFRQLTENLKEVFWLGSSDWNEIFYISPAYEKVWGMSAETLYKNPLAWIEAVHPDDRKQVAADMPTNFDNLGEYVDFREYRIQNANGEIFWIKARAYPIKDANGNINRFAGIAEDITDRKLAEQAVRRTQKIDALGKLTGGIAHDYNNLMGIIQGFTEQLNEHIPQDSKLIKFARNIQHAAQRGAKLTKKLLVFSQDQAIDATVLNINNLLLDQQLMLEKILTARIQLELDLADDLWPVWLDSSELEDAVVNLCINAMHAMESGGRLTLRTGNVQLNAANAQKLNLKSGDYVQLSINDTGCGMDDIIREKIFDPFYTTKGDLGTGLGLSQVFNFVERSYGTITVDSEIGHGSRFTLYFPRSQKTIIEVQEFEKDAAQNLRGNETVLVVDDEQAMVELAKEILSAQGYHVLTANDGNQALAVLKENAVDLIVTDVIMPNTDGYQLAEYVQQIYPHIKLQMVSGFTDNRQNHNSNKILHDNLLQKPYSSKSLLTRVRRLLDEGNMKHRLNHATVLVVDDEEDVRELFKLNLRKLGCSVLPARNGSEAISLYLQSLEGSNSIDVIIMDLNIPGDLSGTEAAEKIRAMNPQAKIIVSSGHSEGMVMTHFQDYGFDAAIEKNFNRKTIKRALEQVLAADEKPI